MKSFQNNPYKLHPTPLTENTKLLGSIDRLNPAAQPRTIYTKFASDILSESLLSSINNYLEKDIFPYSLKLVGVIPTDEGTND